MEHNAAEAEPNENLSIGGEEPLLHWGTHCSRGAHYPHISAVPSLYIRPENLFRLHGA
mgnify:CR=1 FL=1